MPVIRSHNRPFRSIFWRLFLNDLTYLLPAFGALLGVWLLIANSPFWGASLMTLGTFMLMLRINTAFSIRRERRFIEQFKRWMATCFNDRGDRPSPRQFSTCRASRGYQIRRD
ncbi:MAG: hypothetical protein ACOYLF_05210 [Blastocatellia bacterium]|jgi:hypothetical protein